MTNTPSSAVVRHARTGDAASCAAAWRDAGRYYAALDPTLQEPNPEGLVDFFRRALNETNSNALTLVAEADGAVIGFVTATLSPPDPDARWQLQRDASTTRLTIDALVVAETHRRSGVGTLLMHAAEQWGRERGARSITLDTNLSSPLSVPFYENRMGYRRRGIIFRKSLP